MSYMRNLARSFRSDDLRAAYRQACRNGWMSEVDGRGHVVIVAPDGSVRVRLSCTAYSGPATRSKVHEMRRKGALGPDHTSGGGQGGRRRERTA